MPISNGVKVQNLTEETTVPTGFSDEKTIMVKATTQKLIKWGVVKDWIVANVLSHSTFVTLNSQLQDVRNNFNTYLGVTLTKIKASTLPTMLGNYFIKIGVNGDVEYSAAPISESGLHNDPTTENVRLGGKLKQNTTIDGDDLYNLNVLHTPSINLSGSDGTYNSLLRADENGILISGTGLGAVDGSIQIDGTQLLFAVNNGASSIKLDQTGVFVDNLAAKTSETDIVYIDANGKLAKGPAPTPNNSVDSFDVAYMKQIPFTNGANITQATVETAFRATVSNPVLDGYYIAVFRCTQSTPLSKSATVNYQINGQSAATLTAKHGMSVLFKYVNDVLTDIEALTDSAIVDAITAIQNTTTSETANQLIDTDTIHFLTGAGNLPLNRQIQPHVQILALLDQSTGPNYLGQIVPMSQAFISSVGQIRVPLLNFQNSQTVEFEQTINSTTKERVVTANMIGGNGGSFSPSTDLGNLVELGTDNKAFVGNLEKRFPIDASVSSSFEIWASADNLDLINPLDFAATFETSSNSLVFANNSAAQGKLKTPRFRSIEMTVFNMGSILDSSGNMKVKIPRSMLLKTWEVQASVGDEFKASFPRPRVLDVSAPSVSESTSFLWQSDANVPVLTWLDGTHAYYKFVGLNLFDRVQLYLTF